MAQLRSTDDVLQPCSMFSFFAFSAAADARSCFKNNCFSLESSPLSSALTLLHFSRYSSVDENRLCFHEETPLICSEALKCSLVVFLSWQFLKTSSLPGLHLNPLCFARLEKLLSTIPLSPSHLSMEMLGEVFFSSF